MRYRIQGRLDEYGQFKLADICGLPTHAEQIDFFIDVTGDTLAEHAVQLSDVLNTFTIVPCTNPEMANMATNAQQLWARWIEDIKVQGAEATGEFIYEIDVKVAKHHYISLTIDPMHDA